MPQPAQIIIPVVILELTTGTIITVGCATGATGFLGILTEGLDTSLGLTGLVTGWS